MKKAIILPSGSLRPEGRRFSDSVGTTGHNPVSQGLRYLETGFDDPDSPAHDSLLWRYCNSG